MENVGGRSDGIGAEEQRTTAFLAGHDKTPGSGCVAVDIGIYARTRIFRFDTVSAHRGVNVVSVVVAGLKNLGVGLVNGRLFAEFLFQMVESGVDRAVEKPADQTKRKYIAAFKHTLGIKTGIGKSGFGHRGHRHFHYLGLDAEFLERTVSGVFRFFKIGFAEGVDIHNNHATLFKELVILLQCCRVHGQQHIAAVAGGVHIVAYAYLKAGNAAKRTLGSADFGRIVRKCRHLIADACRDIGENVAGKLHAVAGVAGKPHHNFIQDFYISLLQHDNFVRFKIYGYLRRSTTGRYRHAAPQR